MGVLDRLREGLSRTKQQILERFDDIVRQADAPEKRSRSVDAETLDALEELLISADIGVDATDRIITAVQARAHAVAKVFATWSKRRSRGFFPRSTGRRRLRPAPACRSC